VTTENHAGQLGKAKKQKTSCMQVKRRANLHIKNQTDKNSNDWGGGGGRESRYAQKQKIVQKGQFGGFKMKNPQEWTS